MDTRKSLEEEVLSWLDESGDTSTTQTNVRNAILQAHIKRLTEDAWSFMLWPEPQTFNLVAGQKNYVLHQEFGRPLYFVDRTQAVDLKERPQRHLKPSYTDEAYRFIFTNRSPIAAQPGAASKLSLTSTEAADSGSALGFYIRGMTAAGMVTETLNPSGTSAVESSSTFLPGGLIQISKFGTWAGTATLTADAGATEVLSLFSEEVARSYQQIRLLWTPDRADVIEYQFFRQPSPLPYPESIPDIPYPFSRILAWDALLALTAYDGQLDAPRQAFWVEQRDALDLALRQAYLEGQSLNAEPQEVHYVDDDV